MVADEHPVCVLLLPRPLERFVLAEQARELLRAPGVVAVPPPRAGYGWALRTPAAVRERVGVAHARRLRARLAAEGRTPRVVVALHAVQEPTARALAADEETGAARAGRPTAGAPPELWYWRWDRYEAAPDADPSVRARLAELHDRLAAAADLVVAASTPLAAQEASAGRETMLVPPSADAFPSAADAAPPGVVALSLGHLGRRTDWALLRALGERMPDLGLLLVGELHPEETPGDADLAWCRAHPPFAFLGRQDDAATAALLRLADCGVLPFRVDAFNDAALPFRILKAARLGRRTVCPDLAGVRTWERAVSVAPDLDGWEAALRAQAGVRARPDADLRAWALAQTAESVSTPLRERLRAAGVAV